MEKKGFFNGVYIASSLKKISRTFTDINDVQPTGANRVGPVLSSAYTAANNDFQAVLPYLIGLYEAGKLICEELG